MMGIKRWLKETYIDDPHEKSALIAFGIGMPIVLIVFAALLIILK